MKTGDQILDFVGPLGLPSHIEKFGNVICIGGGVGIAPIFPIARALRDTGNNVTGIIGARTKELLFWEEKMRAACSELLVTTDDGSYVRKGFVTDVMKEVIEDKGKDNIALILAIGPQPMMRVVCNETREYGIKTIVSLNSLMVDGTGMCGCCRVTVGGQTKFVCVDGPEFDGHLVDFAELAKRSTIYLEKEREALDYHKCMCGGAS
jgi:ferredoxin--NADP+ reductase